jgi:predicted dehydrogenase
MNQGPLRVGVIGLGQRWQQRYRPALRALRDRFAVQTVCDQVPQRALAEARRQGCAAAAGPAALLETDVEAVLLLDAQWFQLWPVERACDLGKPVLCCAELEQDEHADAVCCRVRDIGLPVLAELAPRQAPALARLRHLLESHLGPARLVLCDAVDPVDWQESGTAALLDACSTLLEPACRPSVLPACRPFVLNEPTAIESHGLPDDRFTSLFLRFADDRAVQLTRRTVPHVQPRVRFRVVAERGSATAVLPGRLAWTDAEGTHSVTIRGQRSTVLLLEKFYRVVREGQPPAPGLDEALRPLRWLQAAQRSRREGQFLALAPRKEG